jgi:ribosome-associated toxin RatA of RatAB toxin-antitoxin module
MVEATVQSIEISATPDHVFAVATDIAAYPQWATGVKSTEVLETDQHGLPKRVRFRVDGMVKEITYVLAYTYDPPHSMQWQAEEGPDLRELEGSYTFSELEGGGTEVVYRLRVEPAFTIPGFLRRQAERQLVGTALRGLRKRVGELADR